MTHDNYQNGLHRPRWIPSFWVKIFAVKGYAKSGRMEQCFELFGDLKRRGIAPSQVTYGILLDGFINQNQLDQAAQIFETMLRC